MSTAVDLSAMNMQFGETEPCARFTRKTKGGRTLHYILEIIQQPVQARACGSGPKSASDRRPIDPPPVLQLRIFEGEHWEDRRDITADYKAEFFVFTSLELARPIAHGRVPNSSTSTAPVLTGVPVGGACYLERPLPACYFLFPDLSIRHEGVYRLKFCLWEETNFEADHDLYEPSDAGLATSPVNSYFRSRMEVASVPFHVYSAKKFPGLTMSTALSRQIAEQGCRIRIRRDIRMRRREPKGASGGDEGIAAQPSDHRARSASNSSMERVPYHAEPRRLSAAEHPPAPPAPRPLYTAPAAPPGPGPQPSQGTGYLDFSRRPSQPGYGSYGPGPQAIAPAAPMSYEATPLVPRIAPALPAAPIEPASTMPRPYAAYEPAGISPRDAPAPTLPRMMQPEQQANRSQRYIPEDRRLPMIELNVSVNHVAQRNQPYPSIARDFPSAEPSPSTDSEPSSAYSMEHRSLYPMTQPKSVKRTASPDWHQTLKDGRRPAEATYMRPGSLASYGRYDPEEYSMSNPSTLDMQRRLKAGLSYRRAGQNPQDRGLSSRDGY